MNTRLSILSTACLLLLLRSMVCPAPSMASDSPTTVPLDGKKLYIPEIKLTRKVNPVITFLYIGSWKMNTKGEKIQSSFCEIDPNNRNILIESPEKLLENSKPRVVARGDINSFLDGITWGVHQITQVAFKIPSPARRQPAVIEISTDSDSALFHNGKFIRDVRADNARASGETAYFPILLNPGENIINIKQFSLYGKPLVQIAVRVDHLRDLAAATQARGGLLKKLLYLPDERTDTPALAWDSNLVNFSPSVEVRDVTTNEIVLKQTPARQGPLFAGKDQNIAPGIYEASYRTENESSSEFFIIGNPDDLLARLQESLSQYNQDSKSMLDIEAQLRRARILLSKENYDVLSRQWQEKIAYTFSCLATFERRLKEGVADIAKDQTGLHIRGLAFGADSSTKFYYRLYVPSTYRPDAPLPLLVIPAARVGNKRRAFIEGPVIANHAEALLYAHYAEKHGFAILWPGYRGSSLGYSYESVYINEVIKAAERDVNIDKHRISVFGTCNAGFNAGRLVTEYPNRFAAIVYDRAIFDLATGRIQSSPSLVEWYKTVNPSNHVIANRNISIFVMHDNTKLPGHGQLELSSSFLAKAKETRDDVVSYLSERPMTAGERMDMMFSWLAPCRNKNPNNSRSNFLAKAGYTGPIMEIFATPLLVVEGTNASGGDLKKIHSVVESFRNNYKKCFHDAECAVKNDTDVTQKDIETRSLVLVGNPQSNSVWEKLNSQLTVKTSPTAVMYGNDRLAGFQPFQAIVRNPVADGKYVLLIGAGDLRTVGQVKTDHLFTAWYDCMLYAPNKIISKLDSLHDALAGEQNPKLQNPPTSPRVTRQSQNQKSQKPKPQNN